MGLPSTNITPLSCYQLFAIFLGRIKQFRHGNFSVYVPKVFEVIIFFQISQCFLDKSIVKKYHTGTCISYIVIVSKYKRYYVERNFLCASFYHVFLALPNIAYFSSQFIQYIIYELKSQNHFSVCFITVVKSIRFFVVAIF